MENSFYWELRRDASKNSRLFEIARVLVRVDHVAASSKTRITASCDRLKNFAP
jgi:hypothetical protein